MIKQKDSWNPLKCATDPIILKFMPNDMINRHKKWKEKVVTSVSSSQHLGYLHALFWAFAFSIGVDYNEICEIQGVIIQLHYLMLAIAAKNKYVYGR